MMKNKIFFLSLLTLCVIVIGLAVWRIHGYYYKRPLRQIEIDLPSRAGEKNFINFSLPKGGYIIKAEIQGNPVADDQPRRIRYGVSFPREGVFIDEEVRLDFSLKVRQVHLRQFTIKNESRGVFFVELLTPSRADIKIKVYLVEIVYFRTVE